MKQLEFQFECSLPDNPFSVEQEHITLQQIMEGNYNVGSPRQDFSDSEDDYDDDYDDMCRGTFDLDCGFEEEIEESQNNVETLKNSEDEHETTLGTGSDE